MRIYIYTYLYIILCIGCSDKPEVISFENSEIVLKKRLLKPIVNFNLTDKGIELNQETTNAFTSNIELRLSFSSMSNYLIIWHETPKEQFNSRFDYDRVKEIWIDDSIYLYQSVTDFNKKIIDVVSLIERASNIKLTYSVNLPTLCSKTLLFNQKVGLTQHFFQRMSLEKGNNNDTIIYSEYITLNDFILNDFLRKNIIDDDDSLIISRDGKINKMSVKNDKLSDLIK